MRDFYIHFKKSWIQSSYQRCNPQNSFSAFPNCLGWTLFLLLLLFTTSIFFSRWPNLKEDVIGACGYGPRGHFWDEFVWVFPKTVGQSDSMGWIAKPYGQESEDGYLTFQGLVKGDRQVMYRRPLCQISASVALEISKGQSLDLSSSPSATAAWPCDVA